MNSKLENKRKKPERNGVTMRQLRKIYSFANKTSAA
jgi:hypothetical protein